jgi:hypothetical protein
MIIRRRVRDMEAMWIQAHGPFWEGAGDGRGGGETGRRRRKGVVLGPEPSMVEVMVEQDQDEVSDLVSTAHPNGLDETARLTLRHLVLV